MNHSCLFGILAFALTPAALYGQDQPDTTSPVEATSPAGASPASQSFEELFQSYKEMAKDFEALRAEFQMAGLERRSEINAELRSLSIPMKEKVSELVDGAVETYRAAPNSDEEVTNLLLNVAAHDILGVGPSSQGADQYERALEVIDALVEGDQAKNHKQISLWGLVAACSVGDFEKAEKFNSLMEELQAFRDPPDEKDQAGIEVFSRAMEFSQTLQQEKALWEAEQAIRSEEEKADDLPRVKIETNKGVIVIELFENEAPQAVGNFVTLVKQGFYDGVVFHRVLPRFMAQGGDPEGRGTGGPGYCIPCECYQDNARNHFRGSLSMAHAGRNTGGSQFFLTFVPTRMLDGRHTVFGRVIEGMEVLADLERVDPDKREQPVDKIIKAEVLRDRGHDYEFDKLPER